MMTKSQSSERSHPANRSFVDSFKLFNSIKYFSIKQFSQCFNVQWTVLKLINKRFILCDEWLLKQWTFKECLQKSPHSTIKRKRRKKSNKIVICHDRNIRCWWCIACIFLHSSSILLELKLVFFLFSSLECFDNLIVSQSLRLLKCLCKSHFKSHFCRNISFSR